jgi:tetratricopeptide (TPR) repeat protein
MGVEICKALGAVHQAGLLHRDIKAHNVMQQDDGRLVLMDFGAGRALADEGVATELAGTPLYLAPELFEGRPATVQSDLYSVGVLLYHLLTGAYPVQGRTVREIREGHRAGQCLALAGVTGLASDRLVDVVNRALDVNPDARCGTADEFAAELAACSRPPVAARWRNGRFLAGPVAGLVVLGAATITALLTFNGRDETPTPETRLIRATGVDRSRSAIAAVPVPTLPSPLTVVTAPPALQFNARDWVLIASFENRTGELLLDGTLEFAFDRELSSSGFVNVAPRERIEDVLALMQKPIDAKVERRLGREIALRDGDIRALLVGRVEKTRGTYAVTSQIVNPSDDVMVTILNEEASGQAELLNAIRRLAFRVREALGEMRSTIEKSQIALENVTTPSLRALQLYSQAAALMRGDRPWQHEPAERLLRESVREDPSFASAHILLAWAIHNQRPFDKEYLATAARAMQLADRTSDVDRHFIVGSYHSMLARTVEADKSTAERRHAIAAYQALTRFNPAHPWGLGNLSAEYSRLNLGHDAAQAISEQAEVRPASFALRLAAVQSFLSAGDASRARFQIDRTERLLRAIGAIQRPEWIRTQLLLAKAAWFDGDGARARQAVDEAAKRADTVWQDDATIQSTRYALAGAYIDLGRFVDARRIAEESPPLLRDLVAQFVVLETTKLSSRPDWEYLRELVSKRLAPANATSASLGLNMPDLYLGLPYYVDGLIQVGLIDEAQQAVDSIRKTGSGGPPSNMLDIEGQLAMAEGRIDDGVRLFEAARQAGPPKPTDLRMALTLADVWNRRGEPQKSMNVLEDATSDGWLECVNYPTPPGCIVTWLRSRDLLAQLYYQLGLAKEAGALDAELLKLLAVADADHPMLTRIKARDFQLLH